MDKEEKRLVKEVQAGSQEAFGRLYDKYIDSIYRFIYLKVNSKEDAQDLTSRVFLRVWEKLEADRRGSKPGYRRTDFRVLPRCYPGGVKRSASTIKNFRAFLYQIARNLVIDYWRQKGQKGDVVGKSADIAETAGIIADESEDLEEKVKLSSDISKIKKALNKVKGDYKDVIIWYYLDELSISEIAKILGKSRGAVRVMVHRALVKLRGLL